MGGAALDSLLSMSILDSDPIAKPLVLLEEFPSQVRYYLKKIQRQSDETIAELTRLYLSQQPMIGGMPRIGALEADDGPAVELLPSYSSDLDKNWEGLKARAGRCQQHESDAGNPYLPRWISKTEDRSNPWLKEMGAISDKAKEALTSLCRISSPDRNASWASLLSIPPTENMEFLEDVCVAMGKQEKTFVPDLGSGTEPDWRWAKALALLGGLGTTAVRVVFSRVDNDSDSGELDYWVTCTEEDLAKDILKGHQTSGFPLGLLRCEWPRLQHALIEEIFPIVPSCLLAALTLHIFKHCRVAYSVDKVIVTYAHKGTTGRVELLDGQLDRPFFSDVNKGLCKEMCFALGIPFPGGKSSNWVADAVLTVFATLTPRQLSRARPVSDKCEFIPAPSVEIRRAREPVVAVRWVNPGVVIKDVAMVDLTTGEVEKDYTVRNEEVIMYDWPITNAEADELRNWRAQLPKTVEPEDAASVIRRKIENINDLGEPEGYNALINAVMTADMARKDLAGSEIGSLLVQEFPLLYVLPVGHTMDSTTNQGKTNFGRLIGRAMVPSITVTQMNMSSSAPAQRSLACPLDLYGTAIFDEFQIPSDPAHFLNSQGIQALATGSTASPGRANENHFAQRLKHPLILVSKVAVAPEDIVNRALPTFLDVLNDQTRATGRALNELLTPTAGILVRLAHLLWMKKNNIVAKLMETDQLSAAAWRFDGHYTIARSFGSAKSIDAYLMKAREQMRRQHAEAERSGLVDQVGMSTRFDPKWYFTHCSENTLQMMQMTSTGDRLGQMSAESAMRALAEDGQTRRFDTVLTQFRIKEYTVGQNFINAITKEKTSSWTRPGWRISYISSDKSTVKIGAANVAYVIIERHTEKDTNGDEASGSKRSA
jgi:hypothetical protein